MLAEEGLVAGSFHVIEHGHNQERRGIGGGVEVGGGGPIDKVGGLRELVHDFAIGALALEQEFERAAGEGEIAVAVRGVKGEERVAAEEPAEAGAGGIGGGVVAGDQAGFVVEGYLALVDCEFGPAEGAVELRVGCGDGEARVEEVGVVVGGAVVVGGPGLGALLELLRVHRDEEREELVGLRFGVEGEFEFERVGAGAFLVGGHDAGRCAGDTDGRGELFVIGVEDVVAAVFDRHPFGAREAEVGGGPHAEHIGGETDGERERTNGGDFEEDGGAGGGGGAASGEHVLADL